MGATIHPFTQAGVPQCTRVPSCPLAITSPLILSVLRSLIRNPFCSVPQSGIQTSTFLLHHRGQLDFLPVVVASCSQDGCHRSRLHVSVRSRGNGWQRCSHLFYQESKSRFPLVWLELCPVATSDYKGGWEPAFPGSGIEGFRKGESPWALVYPARRCLSLQPCLPLLPATLYIPGLLASRPLLSAPWKPPPSQRLLTLGLAL